MADEQSEATQQSLTAALMVRAAAGDDDAQRELVVRGLHEPLARWALEVVLDLQIAEAEGSGGLPPLAPEVDARLEGAVRAMVDAQR